MMPADRRFMSTLFVVSGPLFVLGGFLVAFTDPGAVLVFFGLRRAPLHPALCRPCPGADGLTAGYILAASRECAQWVIAIASASAASAGVGTEVNPSCRRTISATWSLSPLP